MNSLSLVFGQVIPLLFTGESIIFLINRHSDLFTLVVRSALIPRIDLKSFLNSNAKILLSSLKVNEDIPSDPASLRIFRKSDSLHF